MANTDGSNIHLSVIYFLVRVFEILDSHCQPLELKRSLLLRVCVIEVGQGDLAIFVMGGSGRVEIMVKINYSDTAGQYKEGKSGESVKYGSE